MRLLYITLLTTMLIFSVSNQCYGDARIIELVPLVGFEKSSVGGISSDGLVITGSCQKYNPSYEDKPVFWSQDGQVHPLPSPLSSVVSANGKIFAGTTAYPDREACLWSEWSGIVRLGFLPGTDRSYAEGISSDGKKVWGYCGHSSDSNLRKYFIWSQAAGMMLIAEYNTSTGPQFFRFNDDCTVATGRKDDRAFRWTLAGGFESLGALPATSKQSSGWFLVDNGERIIGTSTYGMDWGVIFDWSSSKTMSLMVEPPLGHEVYVNDTTADGKLLVGELYNAVDNSGGYGIPNQAPAWIWTASAGNMRLEDFVQDNYNLDLSGWYLISAKAVSDDGTVIVGDGYNPDWQQVSWALILDELPATPVMQETIPLVVTSFNLKASNNGNFILKAVLPDDLTIDFGIAVKIGDFSGFVGKDDPAWARKGAKAIFKGTNGGITSITVDTAKHTVSVIGQGVDLSGLSMPVSIEVEPLF